MAKQVSPGLEEPAKERLQANLAQFPEKAIKFYVLRIPPPPPGLRRLSHL